MCREREYFTNMSKNEKQSRLQYSLVRVARLHFLLVALFVVQIIIYDAWKLIAPTAVLNRWLVSVGLLVVTTVVWYLAKHHSGNTAILKKLVFVLIMADIAAISFNVYTQRGMASRAVALYAIPIIVSAILFSRAALLATASLCVAAYTTTALSYFVWNFNEGYKIELYGEVGFYSVLFFVLATMLWAAISSKKPEV